MSKEEFFLKLLQEGRDWLKELLPAFIAWHLPAPKKKEKNEQGD